LQSPLLCVRTLKTVLKTSPNLHLARATHLGEAIHPPGQFVASSPIKRGGGGSNTTDRARVRDLLRNNWGAHKMGQGRNDVHVEGLLPHRQHHQPALCPLTSIQATSNNGQEPIEQHEQKKGLGSTPKVEHSI